jgi:hypothetical protein
LLDSFRKDWQNSSLWNEPYRTCQWKTFGDGLSYSGYGKNFINKKTSVPLTYKQMLQNSVRQLKGYITNILLKYGTLLDFDYIQLLENILECELMFYLEIFDFIDKEERAIHITNSLRYIIQLYERNSSFEQKNKHSHLADILSKLPI